ncbi:elongation factor Tu GTP-binding domain protein (macronuclear) [Tetrahymena thermophila SB210]|uniref:Elongation factor Tu GTP-binding domain protein n=1 Tax=Tetrahymena thermophila (strain SB210) TaxID=312017 RepID=I7MHK6_TETTS|nr:elongation factor Tu GTP-binding domain protein [Tetrahymena thermophila SB210]EAS03059.2 elongation factor Tu GTP-binding domain protein [Tetrahymena thermophila SB210]|eukprot:XP_001023304.2 elongation factor Tu GTP-binding domain protein [Tetrahymena thermophila SB210]
MKSSQDLSKILLDVAAQKNISILGTSKGCGVTSLTNFLYKNYGFKPEGDLKIQELELGRITLAIEDKNVVSIDNTNEHFCDKEGIIIVIDLTEKNLDSVQFSNILKTIKKFKLNFVWYFNKLDKAIFDMQKSNPEEVYQLLIEKIEQANQLIEQVNEDQSDYIEEIEPTRSNVLIGSAVDGWAFSLHNFAEEYSSKLKIEPQKLVTKFWGENYYNSDDKTWHITSQDQKKVNRSFCTFIFDPIWRLHLLIRQGSLDLVQELVKQIGIEVDISNKSGRILLRVIMYAWLNSAKAILGAVQKHILGFEEGLLELNRWQVYSKQLEKYQELKSNMIYCFGKDPTTGLTLAKILKKRENKIAKLNAFVCDLMTGPQLLRQIEVTGIFQPYFSKNYITLEWNQVIQGQVVLIKADDLQEGMILIEENGIQFYKTYSQQYKETPSSLENKNPFSIQNYILGTLDKLNPKLKKVFAQKNELFLTFEELAEYLIQNNDFTKQDVSSIVCIKQDCIVLNYSKNSQNKSIFKCFEKAIELSNIKGLRIEIEQINDKAAINEDDLVKAIVNEFKSYI